MSDFIKAEKVVSTSLGLLERELVLTRLVWRDAAGDYALAKGDAITIRLPAYSKAKSRKLRSGAPREKSALHERSIDVHLTDDLYNDVPITDEELTLDIADFGGQILTPVLAGIGRAMEDGVADLMTAATYNTTLTLDTAKPASTLVDARAALNNASVPLAGRSLVVGTEIESAILKSDQFARYDSSGDSDALREAKIGRIAGFDVISTNSLAPDEAYAFHKTAYVFSQRAPVVPAGAPWGASQSYNGLAIRTVRVFDPDEVEDRFIADSWAGFDVVTDKGGFDGNGKFEPAEDPNDAAAQDLLVRAVKIKAA